MSIIHDALKKVQQAQNPPHNQTPEAPSISPNPSPSTPWDEPKTNAQTPVEIKSSTPHDLPNPSGEKIKSILAFLSAVIITFFSVLFIYHAFNNGLPRIEGLAQRAFNQLKPALHKPASVKPLASVAINPPAASPAEKPVTLNIHGVLANDSGNLALINDEIYKQGDMVDGAKIVKIDLNAVTVLVNGKEKTIPVGK